MRNNSEFSEVSEEQKFKSQEELWQKFFVDPFTEEERTGLNSIVSVGAGAGAEVHFLLEKFPNAALTLIEMDPLLVKLLERKFRQNERIRIVQTDASLPEAASHLKADWALIRNPDLHRFPTGWRDVVQSFSLMMPQRGRLTITTHFPHEAEIAEKLVRDAGFTVTAGPLSTSSRNIEDAYIIDTRKSV